MTLTLTLTLTLTHEYICVYGHATHAAYDHVGTYSPSHSVTLDLNFHYSCNAITDATLIMPYSSPYLKHS